VGRTSEEGVDQRAQRLFSWKTQLAEGQLADSQARTHNIHPSTSESLTCGLGSSSQQVSIRIGRHTPHHSVHALSCISDSVERMLHHSR